MRQDPASMSDEALLAALGRPAAAPRAAPAAPAAPANPQAMSDAELMRALGRPAPAAPRRAAAGGGRQPPPAAAPPAMGGQGADTGALTREDSVRALMDQGYPADVALRMSQEQEQYDEAVRPYTLPNGRVVNLRGPGTPVAMAGPRRADDIIVDGMLYRPTEYEPAVELPAADVQGGVERLPMQGDAPATGLQAVANVLSRAPGVQELAENPLVSTIAGAFRGEGRVREGARRLLGQGVRMLPFGEQVGQGLVDEAARNNAILDALNMPFREANTGFNQMGQFGAEVAVTAPVGGLLGRGIGLVGQGVGRASPQLGRGIEAFGRSVAAGGFTPSAVGRPAAGMAPSGLERAGNILLRGSGGATAGALGTALTAPDGGGNESGMLGMTDTQAGAAIGAILPTVAARPAKFAMNRLMDGYQALVGELGATRAANIVRQSLGVDYDAALAALRNARPGETAQQALVRGGVEPSVFMGVGAEVRGAAPDAYLAIEAAQQAAMEAPINRLAGGPNLTAAQLSQRAEKTALRNATVPMQQAELAAADASGAMDVTPISVALMRRADDPSVSRVNSRALALVAAELDDIAARGGGVASAEALYALRREGLDDAITGALRDARGGDISSTSARRADLLRETQMMLDDAIEAAGGTGWRQYLADYASGSETIRRQAMMGVAGRQLRNNPNAFVNLVEGETPDVVSGVFGGNRIDLANQMNPTGVGPSGMDALRSAAEQIRRNQRIDVLAGEGRGAAQELIRQARNEGPISGAISLVARALRPGTAAAMQVGSALLDAKISPQVRTALAQAYQSGANMVELLAMTPLADRAQVQRNLMNPAFWAHLQGGAVNAMTGNGEQPANAMSPASQ
jgi:hypothetical protein